MVIEKENGIVVGVLLIAPIIAMLIIMTNYPEYFSDDAKTKPLRSLFFFYTGSLFLASYYYSHKTFALRVFLWVCEHFSAPRSRKMAFFYFSLGLLAGVGTLLSDYNVI